MAGIKNLIIPHGFTGLKNNYLNNEIMYSATISKFEYNYKCLKNFKLKMEWFKLMKVYDIIILPPEDFYFSIDDLYIKNYNLFVKIVKVLCKKYKNKKILIKFRNSDHKNLFNIQHNNVVTSGKILDYANKNCKL